MNTKFLILGSSHDDEKCLEEEIGRLKNTIRIQANEHWGFISEITEDDIVILKLKIPNLKHRKITSDIFDSLFDNNCKLTNEVANEIKKVFANAKTN